MLKPRWIRPAWRKPPVRSRYHSPSATASPQQPEVVDDRAAELTLRPPLPVAISARKAAALSAIRTKVAGARSRRGPTRRDRVRWLRTPGSASHRGRRHAVGADRPPAGAGTPVSRRVPVTSLGHGIGSLQSRRWRTQPSPALRHRGRCARRSPASSASSTAPRSAPGEVDEVSALRRQRLGNILHILTGALGLLAADYASRLRALDALRRPVWGFTSAAASDPRLLPVNTATTLHLSRRARLAAARPATDAGRRYG